MNDSSRFEGSDAARSVRHDLMGFAVDGFEMNDYNEMIIRTMNAVDFYIIVGRVEIAEGREITILLMSSNGGFFVVNNYNDAGKLCSRLVI